MGIHFLLSSSKTDDGSTCKIIAIEKAQLQSAQARTDSTAGGVGGEHNMAWQLHIE
jgi:hypothetical protein